MASMASLASMACLITSRKLIEVNANWTKLKEREDLKTGEVDEILKKIWRKPKLF